MRRNGSQIGDRLGEQSAHVFGRFRVCTASKPIPDRRLARKDPIGRVAADLYVVSAVSIGNRRQQK